MQKFQINTVFEKYGMFCFALAVAAIANNFLEVFPGGILNIAVVGWMLGFPMILLFHWLAFLVTKKKV